MDVDVAWAKRQETIRGALKLFRVIVAGARQHAEAIRRDFGISAAQYWMLSELARAPGSRPLDIAKATAMHVSSTHLALDVLQRLNFIAVSSAGDTPQSTRWAITEQGRHLLGVSDLPAQGSIGAALHEMDDRSIVALAEGLQTLVGAMRFKDGDAALTPLSDLLG